MNLENIEGKGKNKKEKMEMVAPFNHQ